VRRAADYGLGDLPVGVRRRGVEFAETQPGKEEKQVGFSDFGIEYKVYSLKYKVVRWWYFKVVFTVPADAVYTLYDHNRNTVPSKEAPCTPLLTPLSSHPSPHTPLLILLSSHPSHHTLSSSFSPHTPLLTPFSSSSSPHTPLLILFSYFTPPLSSFTPSLPPPPTLSPT
jgi:hypothetical protein